jgi:hypothetical protein
VIAELVKLDRAGSHFLSHPMVTASVLISFPVSSAVVLHVSFMVGRLGGAQW